MHEPSGDAVAGDKRRRDEVLAQRVAPLSPWALVSGRDGVGPGASISVSRRLCVSSMSTV